MSNLLKQALLKGKPPKPDRESDDDEEKDTFDDPTATDAIHRELPRFGNGPVRAFGLPPATGKSKQGEGSSSEEDPNSLASGTGTIISCGLGRRKDISTPLLWSDYYDSREFMDNGTPVYICGSGGPLFFCLHGAGDSACSFACLAKEVKQFGTLVSFDFRGHGDNKNTDSEDLSIETLLADTDEVLQFVVKKFPDLCIVVVGHSMGGSAAAKFTNRMYQAPQFKGIIQGLVVIDVVEGTAIDALPFMETIVSSRPRKFDSLESAITWHTRTNQVRNTESARVSGPAKVRAATGKDGKTIFEWKVDLLKSERHWMSWFKGLTGDFLSVHMPKLLMLAEKERMDKDLTIAQMQGKFKLVVIQDVGHYMQEDNFKKTAYNLHLFLENFRIPANLAEASTCKEFGIGKFHPVVRSYDIKK